MKRTAIYKNLMRGSVLIAICALLTPGIALAQMQYYDTGLLQRTIDRKPADFRSGDTRLGSFRLDPGVELTYETNDNIFYRNDLGISDSIIHVRPWLNLKSDWSRHELDFNFYADLGRYDKWSSEDYDDWVANLDGRIDVKRGAKFNYGATYRQLHEDRGSPDGGDGIKPTEFTITKFKLGYTHTFNRLVGTLHYNRDDTDYDDNYNLGGELLDSLYRDHIRDVLSLKLNYEMSEKRDIFLNLAGNTVDYTLPLKVDGYPSGSEGYRVQGGVQWDMTGVIEGRAYLEYIDQEHNDTRFENTDGVGVGAYLDWTPSKLTNVYVRFVNAPLETMQPHSSGYYRSLYSVRLQHELRRNLLINARASYTDDDYNILRSYDGAQELLKYTETTRAGLGLSYLFNRNFYISGGYVYEKQVANLHRYEYRTNRWFLTLGLEL